MIGFCFITLSLVSCSFPSYIFEDNNSKTGLNFKEGKWLLNEIDAPNDYKTETKDIIYNDLKKYLGDRFSYRFDINGIIIPKKVDLYPSQNILKELKKGTNYDYFVNVKVKVIKNSLKDVDLTNHKYNKNNSKSVEVYFEVYDLNLLEIIYSKKAIGSIKVNNNNNSDIILSKSVSKLVIGSTNKVLKNIDRTSIK